MGFWDFGTSVVNATGDAISGATDFVMDTGQDIGAGIFGGETSQEEENRERSEAAQARAASERAALEQRDQGLEGGISGYDPPSINGQENWQSFGHQEIFDRNQNIQEGRLADAVKAWRSVGTDLRTMGGEFAPGLSKIVAAGWEGEAGKVAATAGDKLSDWMTRSGDAFELTGNRVSEAGTAAGQAKAMVPEPTGHNLARSFGSGLAAGALSGGVGSGIGAGMDAVAQMRERQEAERQAQETMGRVYSSTLRNVDAQVPSYQDVQHKPVPPPDPQPRTSIPSLPPPVDPAEVGGDSTTGSRTASSAGGDATPGANLSPAPDVPASSGSAWTPSGGGPGGPGSASGNGGYLGWPGKTVPTSDVGGPASVPPTGAGGGGGAAAGGRVGGAGGIGGGAGAGAGARGATPGVGGRSGVGPLAAGAGAGAAAGRGGATGRPMGGAMGGPAGAAQRGPESDDEEHDRPSWLEEQDDVWFNDMPGAAPPVLE